jgi:MraZ protein
VESDGNIVESEVQGLNVFVGEYAHALDPKKRLTIPAVWRAQVGKPHSLYVMPDFHRRCLNVFPGTEMLLKLEQIRKHSLSDRKAQEFLTILGASSDLVAWDVQGRIRIKDKLLTFAGLTQDVVLLGAMNKFQLWNPANRPADTGDIDQGRLAEAAQYVQMI